jgi:arylsulfatase A-like enzyme
MKSFINKNKDHSFFLYYALNDIHVPRAPNDQFIGKSTMGRRGDAIAEMDWQVGEVLKALKDLGLRDNTLIIFTSDNGPVLDDGYADSAVRLVGNDKPSGPFKGGKYSAYEAGTRVPTIVYWPGKVNKGISHALVSQVDLYASFARLTGQELKDNEAPDSFNMLDAWLGKNKQGRKVMLEESYTMSLRDGKWKYIAPQSKPTPGWLKNKDIAIGLKPFPQLYNLDKDIGEDHNVIKKHSDQGAKMKQLLHQILNGKGSRF